VANETLVVQQIVNGQLVRLPVDLQPLFASGLLLNCQPDTAPESAALVQYAVQLDDGEAMCLALAKLRGWTVATDERKGRRIALADGIAVLNTIEVVRIWAEGTNAGSNIVRAVIDDIASLGRYRPAANVPGADWWRKYGGKTVG
jgi:hypothetical protein